MLKKFLILCFAFLIIGVNTVSLAGESWDKIFPKSDKLNIKKVQFRNRYGIILTGDLYMPKKIKRAEKLPAIAVAGPFGAVKEQASGFYAQTLAEEGFITLAFDPSYTGESSGMPRSVNSPDINTEDFSAAVDYLSNFKKVNPDRIGILGICGFGGYAINAAAMDTRIKATVTSTMYDMTRVSAKGYNDSMDENARYEMKQKLNKQRTEDFKKGVYAKAPSLPSKLKGDEPQFIKDYYDYYKTKRGFHKRSINSNGNWNMTAVLGLMNMPILAYSGEIRTPVLLVHGEKAHSRYFSEDAYKNLKGDNKELYIVEGANHVDLYDNTEKIPFAKITEFFKTNLK